MHDCSGASADKHMEEEDEEGAPAIRLGDADREASQSAGDSLAPSHSDQYDSNEGESVNRRLQRSVLHLFLSSCSLINNALVA